MESNSYQSNKTTIIIYFKGDALPLAFYKGTPAIEIQRTIKMAFNIPEDKILQYLDEDATLTVLSSYISQGCKLFARIKQSFTVKTLNEIQPKQNSQNQWYWLTPSNQSHTISNNGLTVQQKSNQSQSYVYGSLLIKGKIEIYYVLIWEKFTCCNHASVYWTLPSENFTSSQLKEAYSKIDSSFLSSGPFGPTVGGNQQNRILGFYVNMKKKKIIYTDHQKKIVLGEQKFEANIVRPLLFFKHTPVITIQETIIGHPKWLKP